MKITAVHKDEHGTIQQYQLENGTIVDKAQAVQMVANKEIDNCNLGTTKTGTKSIRSNNDGDPSNNLDNLPTF